MKAADETPKWKIVENVVAAVERSLITVSGSTVIANAAIPELVSGVSRQVDVCVVIPVGLRVLRIGIEVRDKSEVLDLPEIEQLIAKLQKLDIDARCIVSVSGFTATARDEAVRNGVELRQITQIDNPEWWLASEMPMDLRQVELLQWQVNFRPEEIESVRPLTAGVDGTELLLTLANGESGSLFQFVSAQGPRAIDDSKLAHLSDQDTFTATIDFSDMGGAKLTCPRGSLPLPQSVYALYRLHKRTESVKLAAFAAGEGINAFSGLSAGWGKQVTLVTKLQPDGGRSLSFAADDPGAPKTTMERRPSGVGTDVLRQKRKDERTRKRSTPRG